MKSDLQFRGGRRKVSMPLFLKKLLRGGKQWRQPLQHLGAMPRLELRRGGLFLFLGDQDDRQSYLGKNLAMTRPALLTE